MNTPRHIAWFTERIARDPNDADAYYHRGMAYFQEGEITHAIKDFNKAIELNPNHLPANQYRVDAYLARGRVYDQQGDLARAIEAFNMALGLNPHLALPHYNRGVVYLRLKKWDKAKSNLTTARDMGVNIINEFRKDHGGVAGFSVRYGVELPEGIANMLTLRQL